MTAEIRRLPGPFATRVCTRADAGQAGSAGHVGYAWREERRSRLTGLRDASELAALAPVLPATEGCVAVLPRSDGDTLVWSPVPTSTLAVDVVFGPGEVDAAAFHALGVFLAALHAAPIPPGLSAPRTVRPVDPALRSARVEARRRLGGTADDPAPPPGPAVLTHGRFSLGQLAWGPVPAVMGWREAGPAPALTDVDLVLSELAEADAIRAGGRAALAAAFVAGYGPAGLADPDGLATRLRGRVLDHVALRAAVTGDRRGPSALFELVLARLDGFCAEVLRASALSEGVTDVR